MAEHVQILYATLFEDVHTVQICLQVTTKSEFAKLSGQSEDGGK
jgi:hypothetical protein